MVEVVKDGNIRLLQRLLDQGENVNEYSGELGNTLLHTAAWKGCKEMVNVLIKAGGNMWTKNKRGFLATHIAATYGRLSCLDSLLQSNSDLLHVPENNGNTVLHIASSKGHLDIVEYLIEAGADSSLRNRDGNTCLHNAVAWKRERVLKRLIKYTDPSRLNDVNNNGYTLLHLTALKGDASLAKILLQNGVDLNIKDKKGKLPVQLSSLQIAKVFMLFQHSIDIKQSCQTDMLALITKRRYEEENTALHIISMFPGNHNQIRQLIRNGADVNATNQSNQTPLHVALSSSCALNAEMLLNLGANVNNRDESSGKTLLHVAAQHDVICSPTLMLKLQSFINVRDHLGETPLMYSVKNQSRDSMLFLLRNNADATIKDVANKSVIHHAGNNLAIVEDLIKARKGLLDMTDGSGNTLLMSSIIKKNLKLISLLLNYDADKKIKNRKGQSAYALAINSQSESIISLFKNAMKP